MKVYKVVGPHGLEAASLDGWELVHTIASSRADKVSLQTPIAVDGCEGSNGNYSTPGRVETCYPREEVVQVHEPMFMVSKEREVITREQQLKAELQGTVDKMTAMSLNSQNDDRDIKDLTAKAASWEKRFEDLNKTYNETQAKTRKLEGDLAKVRTAVGTKAFEEALK
jgi:hypothetical protein